MKIFAIVLLIIAALLALSIIPFWICLKKPENKYIEHEGRMSCIDIWGIAGTIIVMASMMYFD